jgi:similar to spore coat protein
MNEFMQNITGMDGMTDQMIAADFLFATKSGIKSYAVAITESANPEIKQMLRNHLDDAIDLHQGVTTYMIDKGYYHPADVEEQLKVDMAASSTVLNNTKK